MQISIRVGVVQAIARFLFVGSAGRRSQTIILITFHCRQFKAKGRGKASAPVPGEYCESRELHTSKTREAGECCAAVVLREEEFSASRPEREITGVVTIP